MYFGIVGKPETILAPIDTEQVYIIARAFAEYLKPKKVLVGRDTRLSANKFFEKFTEGLGDAGVDVFDLGITTTSMVYFASGRYDYDAAVNITASHTPREINGFKMVRKDADIIGSGSGIEELRNIALAGNFTSVGPKGSIKKVDIVDDYVESVCRFINPAKIAKFKLVLDSSSGPMFKPLEKILPRLNSDVIKLNFEPNGDFPAHDPNPLIPENREEAREAVLKEKADLGVMWDGDGDRIMFIDEKGDLVPGDFITVLFAKYFLKRNPGVAVVYNTPSSWAVKNWVTKLGGRAIMQRTGHAFIKQKNREVDAFFAGELSGHYYYKHTYYAENDLIPFLTILDIMTEEKKPLSALLSEIGEYYPSGEINFEVSDREKTIGSIKEVYKNMPNAYFLDGVSVEFPDWHFNVRPSLNDPLVRLNVETTKKEDLEKRISEVSKVIGGKLVP
ncbi:MAG: hypothetical protein A2172_03185 [Candidatus Woykebacteria bacterium RBG_13_40_15]|uniref:Phosphomannomutase n=1 Tax=Candidatus Woykebacteria bacterium RBG_13_40_15 TaxID=1802593 RepID=A0A1G1W5S1_9BACT|nr:MAG: hypothetical protein A2172_03185 [Candidatus Woykebacteria bacterium RBG_13_40_15]